MDYINIAPIPWRLAIQKKVIKKPNKDVVIGVLALQGDFLEHMQIIERLGIAALEVRSLKALKHIDGLIMPGGESTTMANLLDVFNMKDLLVEKIRMGLPVWGTCAGMILLAKKLKQNQPVPLGLMDITVDRNAFGRQLESFSGNLTIQPLGKKPLHAAFIRAPIVTKVGTGVKVLAKLLDGRIVAAIEKNMLATAFHPELTVDTRMHEYFLSMVQNNGISKYAS